MKGKRLWNTILDRIYGPEGDPPVSFTEVQRDERKAIETSAAWRNCDSAPPGKVPKSQPVDKKELVGLAFSGGGIRSATFNLGLIQALADLRMLRTVDYLSTVSGGSFIGSWLSALIHRENRKAGDDRENRKPANESEAYGICKVEERLRTGSKPKQPNDSSASSERHHEDPAVTFLRRYSNYLTPKVGLFTADTWSAVSIYLRNLILNLILLILGLSALLLLPRLLIAITRWVSASGSAETLGIVSLGAAALFGAVMAWLMGSSFSSLMTNERPRSLDDADDAANPAAEPLPKPQQSAVLWRGVLPLVLIAFLISRWLPEVETWSYWILGVPLAYGGGWALAMASALRRSQNSASQNLKAWFGLIITALGAGLVAGPLLQVVSSVLKKDEWAAWVVGLPLVLLWLLLVGLLQTGLMGHGHRDHQREWLSRFGGWLLIIAAIWATWFAMIIYAPVLLSALKGWTSGAAISGWLAATVSGLVASRSRPTGKGSSLVQSVVLAVAPYVFVVGLLATLAVALDRGVSQIDNKDNWSTFVEERDKLIADRKLENETRRANKVAGKVSKERQPFWGPLYHEYGKLLDKTLGGELRNSVVLLGLILFSFVAGGILSWRIDVNEFSMHGFYRNRLVRCYLGASVDPKERHRSKQPFTGFHESDDIPLGSLFPTNMGHRRLHGKSAPIHLINTSINLVGGEELAWQERKAAPFVLSSLYCGFDPREDGFRHESDTEIHKNGYRKTASGSRGYGSSPVPLTLGSAVAISGAAASPNMGFHSTPALAFLLTVFNIRIGWWLGNPRHRRAWTRSGPFFAMMHLFMELFGKTRGRDRYVYLTDGEHFENLGVYELIRRRCRFIIATDVGADASYDFDNLGNAIRKCRNDLGVEIEINTDPIVPRDEDGFSQWHCAVGKIHYPPKDGSAELGTLLYIKSSLTGDEPADILAYARANAPFPHQTTADQFFDESQFESYRRLGHHVAMEVLKDSVEVATETHDGATRAGATQDGTTHDGATQDGTTQDHGNRDGATQDDANRDSTPNGDNGKPQKILKLEKLLVALGQRWYPPSTADSRSFVRHTATLDQLFERARQTPELAFLDAQIYPEWYRFLDGADLPIKTRADQRADTLWLPKTIEERRQGFYFCNSLIQLMENVYLDLDLERDFDHPDHRGWMNLFKHWSWSGLFRATWAICAATYGKRFQAFCKRRLDLELGKVGITRLTPQTGSERLEVNSFREAAKNQGPAFLNFLEREQIEIFLDYGGTPVFDVVQFELSVDGTAVGRQESEKILRFGFGYALLTEDDRVVLMRIQDHIRTMGLGRQALTHLIRKIGTDGWPTDQELLDEYASTLDQVSRQQGKSSPAATDACRRFHSEFHGGEKLFVSLLQSVRREIREESMLQG